MSHPPPAYRVSSIGHDRAALDTFYREHVTAILRYATRRSPDPSTAADIVSEVFLAAISAAPSYREEAGSPIAWLHGIARNVIAAERRKSERAAAAEKRIAGHRLLDADDVLRLEEQIDAERTSRALLARIAHLPEGEQAVLELVSVDGLTVADAAAALGIKPATARVRLFRARRSLRHTPIDLSSEVPHPSSLTVPQEAS
jgi:RNA polymerase sigma-70 factor (ECF subfamily)